MSGIVSLGQRVAAPRAPSLVLVLLMLALAVMPVAAQGAPLTIDSGTLRILPEYDDPGLLVIFYGSFGNISSYPQPVTFPVPAAARDIQTTELDNTNGSLLVRDAQRQGDQVTYSLEKQPGFQVEYYLDRVPSGNDRTVTFTWRAPYAIKSLLITAEQPARSENFTIEPKEDSAAPGQDGLTLYQIKRTDIAAGDEIQVTMKYTKSDTAPSFPRNTQTLGNTASQSTSPPQPASAATSPIAGTNWPAVALIAIGTAALAGAAVYWYMERRQDTLPAASGRRVGSTRPAPRPAGPAAGSASESRFCPKCGRPYETGDRFCGSCGTPRE